MKSIKCILLTGLTGMLLLFTGCEDDDPENISDSQGLTSGFLIVSQTETNRFVRYTPELPTGTFDVSLGQSFQEFTFRDQFRGQLFIKSQSSNQGIEKFVVTEAGALESVANLSTPGFAFPVEVIDENTGYYNDNNNIEELVIFDPATMENTSPIDLSSGFFFEEANFQNYGGITVRGTDMFVPYRPFINNVYAVDSLVYNVVDLTTNSYVKTIFLPGHISPRVFNDPVVDEQGNIFHLTTGDQVVPNTFKPSIIKIPAGSTDFDRSYEFRPLDGIPGGAQLPTQLLDRFYYGADGIAYALGNVRIPPGITQIVADAGGVDQLTEEELLSIRVLLATDPSFAWLRIDLNAQTVSIIDGIPLTSPSTSLVEEIDGNMYFGSASANLSVIYRYDPVTQTSAEAFRLSQASGEIFDIIDLSRNN